MNSELQTAVITLIFSAIVGGIVKLYLDYKTKLLENLWNKRLIAYSEFVKLTALFPEYPFHNRVTWAEVVQLSISFRDWYFQGNGIIASKSFRNIYFEVQKYIASLITADSINNKTILEPQQYKEIQNRCSNLRTQMARELETRENPIWFWFKKPSKA